MNEDPATHTGLSPTLRKTDLFFFSSGYLGKSPERGSIRYKSSV
jgi:hypothetical protein